jgi:3-deoxy-7-phosphoheptulonate synthase
VDGTGRVGVVRTRGNPHCHLVLRGGNGGPNYTARDVTLARETLEHAGINPRVLVDCSHDNSRKNYLNQPEVLSDVGAQVRSGAEPILGVMVESHLVAGRQDLKGSRGDLVYGQSITDACVDFATTERMLLEFAEDVTCRRASA